MLFWLLILGLIIFLLSRGGKTPSSDNVESKLAQRNIEWIKFIAAYRKVAKTKSEKALIDRMLNDADKQGIVAGLQIAEPPSELDPAPATMAVAASEVEYQYEPVAETKYSAPAIETDNVALLLYFGAFLFVASVGLFIAFGGANGAVRTTATFLVMGVMYGMGIWLFNNKPKLAQAGIAFSGMGMTIAPLVGFAAYYYLFAQANGPIVWFVTSLMCMAMYIHALRVFRRPLISYILIFTFLSLFESGVSIIDAPIYYFGWAMALVGIILAVASRLKGFWPELRESSRGSSQLLLPLSVLASLSLVPDHGAGQLGVSLLLAAAFYGLEALNTEGSDRENSAMTAHVMAIASLVCMSYAASQSWKVVAISVLVINALQMLAVLLVRNTVQLWRNFASVLMVTAVAGWAAAWVSPGILLAATALLIAIGAVVWVGQARAEGYALGIVAWMSFPLVLGQVYLSVRLDAASQAAVLLSALFIQMSVYVWHRPKNKDPSWDIPAQQLYLISAITVIAVSMLASPWVCLIVSSAVTATLIILAEHEKDGDWAVAAGLTAVVPAMRAFGSPDALAASTVAALLVNIFLSLRFRQAQNRWISTVLWLFLPVSLGSGITSYSWTAAAYAWAYLVVMMGLILSRIIARGSLLVSAKVPLASYAKSASYSYVTGYWLAALISVGLALVASDSRLHASLILSILTVIVYWLGRYIEKRNDFIALIPFLVQAVLWSALRPVADESSMITYLLLSTILAVASYFVPTEIPVAEEANAPGAVAKLQESAMAAAYIAPASVLVVSEVTWAMPLGLLIAGALTYYHARNTTQQNRELASAVMVGSLLWFMWYFGVRELQAYTHVVVAMLAAFAYWRSARGESSQSDQYLMYMLAMATIPLGLQALSGQAGGLYGWWLLLEQIAFMLVGMAIKKRIVTMWGLYVAVGAVLYQLRDLGWAALTVLAMFLIGIAVYKLQKPSDKS